MYRLRVCDGHCEKIVSFAPDQGLDACVAIAPDTARTWVEGGDWGPEGASVPVRWVLLDDDGEDYLDADGDPIEGTVTVEIEPDHEYLIRVACGGRHDDRHARCCGVKPGDHDWTVEGEGGCKENPGFWSAGGTAFVMTDHCRTCGLRRRELHLGAQKNPGEHDTVEYAMPHDWCRDCQKDGCECEKETDQ